MLAVSRPSAVVSRRHPGHRPKESACVGSRRWSPPSSRDDARLAGSRRAPALVPPGQAQALVAFGGPAGWSPPRCGTRRPTTPSIDHRRRSSPVTMTAGDQPAGARITWLSPVADGDGDIDARCGELVAWFDDAARAGRRRSTRRPEDGVRGATRPGRRHPILAARRRRTAHGRCLRARDLRRRSRRRSSTTLDGDPASATLTVVSPPFEAVTLMVDDHAAGSARVRGSSSSSSMTVPPSIWATSGAPTRLLDVMSGSSGDGSSSSVTPGRDAAAAAAPARAPSVRPARARAAPRAAPAAASHVRPRRRPGVVAAVRVVGRRLGRWRLLVPRGRRAVDRRLPRGTAARRCRRPPAPARRGSPRLLRGGAALRAADLLGQDPLDAHVEAERLAHRAGDDVGVGAVAERGRRARRCRTTAAASSRRARRPGRCAGRRAPT